ncbi:MAG TPA: choice-of-anchor tandem repeat NxxGxxAF-containing protein [Planctomycetota bacterium]
MACSSRAATLLLLSLASTTAAAQSILSQHGQIVQACGDAVAAVPGVTISSTTSNFDSPVMDQNGTIVYRARLAGAVTTLDDRAYFMGRANGDLAMILRAGDQAPGLPAGIFLRSDTGSAQGPNSAIRISPYGEILFWHSTLSDDAGPAVTTANDTALFWGPAGNFTVLAREGDQVPFLPAGINYGPLSISLQNNAINASGEVLFPATLLGAITTANDSVLITGSPGNLVAVSREGDVLPNGEVVIPVSGSTMSFINQINQVGQVLHELRFDVNLPSTATAANDRALAIWSGGTDTIIAREGQQAPGLPAGVLFATPTNGWTVDMGGAAFTLTGKTAFFASLDGGGTLPGVDDRALYFGGIGGLNVVMRRGDACPGLPGITFGVIGTSGLTCNETEVAFVGFTVGGTTADDSGLWRGSNLGNLTQIAREGDNVPTSVLAPSLNGPWKFGQFNNGTNNVLLNGRGDLMFQATVTDSVATKNVWLCSSAGLGLQLLLDYTETFTTPLGSGTLQSVSSTAGFNSGDGGQPHFNNQGDFVVRPGLLAPVQGFVMRGHVGSLQAKPASISGIFGGTQYWAIDCGPAQAFNIYAVISSATGTRPGVPSPLGPQTIPLNFDAWTQLSLDLANSSVYTNSLWFLDAQGRSTASFNLPGGLPGAQGLELHHAVVVLNGNLASTFVSEPASMRVY